MLALIVAAVAFACDGAVAPEAFEASLVDAEAAFGAADVDAFLAVSDRIQDDLPCLSAVPPRAVTARLHRVVGLRAFADRDAGRVGHAFAAARDLDSSAALPEALVPPGHPVRAMFDVARGGGPTQPFVAPASGFVSVDGARVSERPTGRSALVAWHNDVGAVQAIAYLWPTDPLPNWAPAPPALTVDALAPDLGPRPPPEARAPVGLWVGAGSAAVLSGVLYAVAANSASRYADGTIGYDDGPAARSRTNALVGASAAAAATSATLGASALLVGKF